MIPGIKREQGGESAKDEAADERGTIVASGVSERARTIKGR